MVRLKVYPCDRGMTGFALFQFHNGSIKSASIPSLSRSMKKFQFHNGSIKSLHHHLWEDINMSFNSTMVRLKASFSTTTVKTISCFNSTMVRLKGGVRWGCRRRIHCFNSTMVRLKGNHRGTLRRQQPSFNSTMVRLKEISESCRDIL